MPTQSDTTATPSPASTPQPEQVLPPSPTSAPTPGSPDEPTATPDAATSPSAPAESPAPRLVPGAPVSSAAPSAEPTPTATPPDLRDSRAQVSHSAAAATRLAAVPSPMSMARSITANNSLVTGAEVVSTASESSYAIYTDPVLSFPRQGDGYLVLTTGRADILRNANSSQSSGTDLNGPSVRGNTDFDVTVFRIDVAVPNDVNCMLGMDFQYFTEEYKEYIGSRFNDAFIAEVDQSTWTTNDTDIIAPHNFAFDPSGKEISVNAAGASSMTATAATGTTYDGATPLLTAAAPITPGHHSIYLSIFDQGDQYFDSAVLIDNLRFGRVEDVKRDCRPGAVSVDSWPNCPAPGSEVLVGLDRIDVKPASGSGKWWRLSYDHLDLDFKVIRAAQGSRCTLRSNPGVLNVLVDFSHDVHGERQVGTSTSVATLDFLAGAPKGVKQCNFGGAGPDVTNNCYLTSPPRAGEHAIRWSIPGFTYDVWINCPITVCHPKTTRTPPKTFYVTAEGLPNGKGANVYWLTQAAETHIHEALIDVLPAVSRVAMFQDPPAEILVETDAGAQVGATFGGGPAVADVPGSAYYSTALATTAFLIDPVDGNYMVELSGPPGSQFSLDMQLFDFTTRGLNPTVVRKEAIASTLDAAGRRSFCFTVGAGPPCVPRYRGSILPRTGSDIVSVGVKTGVGAVAAGLILTVLPAISRTLKARRPRPYRSRRVATAPKVLRWRQLRHAHFAFGAKTGVQTAAVRARFRAPPAQSRRRGVECRVGSPSYSRGLLKAGP